MLNNIIPFFDIYIALDRNELRSSSDKKFETEKGMQAQISSYTLLTLKKYVFFKDIQMILV